MPTMPAPTMQMSTTRSATKAGKVTRGAVFFQTDDWMASSMVSPPSAARVADNAGRCAKDLLNRADSVPATAERRAQIPKHIRHGEAAKTLTTVQTFQEEEIFTSHSCDAGRGHHTSRAASSVIG